MKIIESIRRCWSVRRRICVIQALGVAFFAACAFCSGCASSGYLKDRMRDGADVFTLSVQRGVGVDAQASFLTVALGFESTYLGLEDGRMINNWTHEGFAILPTEKDDQGTTFACGLVLLSMKANMNPSSTGHCYQGERNKRYSGFYLCGLPIGVNPLGMSSDTLYSPHSATKIEIGASLGLGLRFGFNPGELLDFLLGWTTLDIYNDDLEWKKQKEKIEPKPDGDGLKSAP